MYLRPILHAAGDIKRKYDRVGTAGAHPSVKGAASGVRVGLRVELGMYLLHHAAKKDDLFHKLIVFDQHVLRVAAASAIISRDFGN